MATLDQVLSPAIEAARRLSRIYVVFATPRSGSFLLCSGLKQTGLLGRPTEYFGAPQRSTFSPHSSVRLPIYLETLYEFSAERTGGVFGTKLMYDHFTAISSELSTECGSVVQSSTETLNLVFPNYACIFLQRSDKVAQAVSFARALQSGCWSMPTKGEVLSPIELITPYYDSQLISRCYEKIRRDEELISQLIDTTNTFTLRMRYEDLISDFNAEITRACNFLVPGLSGTFHDIKFEYTKMSDRISAEWAERFRQDYSLGAPL